METNGLFYFEVGLIFISGFLVRAIFIIKYQWFGSDTFRNFRHGKEIKLYGQIPPRSPKVIGDINYGFHLYFLLYLISFLNNRYHQKKFQYISPVFDILTALLGYLFLSVHFKNIYIPPIAISIYLFSPILIYQSVSLNARQLANFFATISIYFIYLFIMR